eukprot:CAMPEP_0177563014 /NCGR_PEP_ID=MMETSP0369-20130122/72831_1 /TAXON_ID=447022 ORGANISM="Scrippsiella hangoei-like, Strain SHHI-4" /NCGR_SAMPLE_ID=MMETSP0369 /ASSEMBLY_ACC=CAM_ASM_000364 /LENGTH=111 /DNA_ID=CAMNT_0019050157 /DNA_START=1 /DNA_END=336 /DNA_ORIENTATION=+
MECDACARCSNSSKPPVNRLGWQHRDAIELVRGAHLVNRCLQLRPIVFNDDPAEWVLEARWELGDLAGEPVGDGLVVKVDDVDSLQVPIWGPQQTAASTATCNALLREHAE